MGRLSDDDDDDRLKSPAKRERETEGEAKDRLMTLDCLMWTVDDINTMISFCVKMQNSDDGNSVLCRSGKLFH